jgi:SAM-dependent methyltransferase
MPPHHIGQVRGAPFERCRVTLDPPPSTATIVGMPADREQLRTTFDSAARLYHQARPDYPDSLFDELASLAGLHPGDQLMEVGCATGKATIPLARRGYQLTCVELGRNLAAEARRNLAGYPGVEVIEDTFETWEPTPSRRFDLVFAANAWHWIDPDVRYRKAWQLLRPDGHVALWDASHVVPADGDPFFIEIQPVYDEIGEGLPAGFTFPAPGHLADQRAEIEASGLFTDIRVRQFGWEIRYTAESYLALLDTFSNHIAMRQARRDKLYDAIRQRLADRPDGQLTRHWGSVLHVARRVGHPDGPRVDPPNADASEHKKSINTGR